MSGRAIETRGRSVWLAEDGEGRAAGLSPRPSPTFTGASAEPLVFHRQLATDFRLIAPAHPGCSQSNEDDGIDSVEDLVFHYLEVLDELGLDRFRLAGADMGGWIGGRDRGAPPTPRGSTPWRWSARPGCSSPENR